MSAHGLLHSGSVLSFRRSLQTGPSVGSRQGGGAHHLGYYPRAAGVAAKISAQSLSDSPSFRKIIYARRVQLSATGIEESRAPAESSPSYSEDDGDELRTEEGGGGGGVGGNGNGNGGGGDGENNEEDNGNYLPAEVTAILSTSGRTFESINPLLGAALASGAVSADCLKVYFKLEKARVARYFLRFEGFMERLLADPLFLTKVGIEVGVGIVTKTTAEVEKRRGKFWKELDFVCADVVMALIADFMLVWLPAPTLSLRPCKVSGLQKFMCQIPDNAFQKVLVKGTDYTILQRAGSVAVNGSKLLGVGLFSSFVGTGLTNGIGLIKKKVSGVAEQKEEQASAEPPLLETSFAYGTYMATSSNLRYQIVAGVFEQRLLEPLLTGNNAALSLTSFLLRTGNTFLGSLMWVDYARWIGVQPSDD